MGKQLRLTRKHTKKMKGGVGGLDILYEKVDTLMDKIKVLHDDPIYEDLQLIGESFHGLKYVPSKEKILFLQDFNHGEKYESLRLYIEKSYFPEDINKLKQSIQKAQFQTLAEEIRQTMEQPQVEVEAVPENNGAAAAAPESPKKKRGKKKSATEALVTVFAGHRSLRSKGKTETTVAVPSSQSSLGLKGKKSRKHRK
jgi:hypothetical protein